MKLRVIIADDHPMVCQGLREIIERTPDLEVVATAHDGFEAERLARTTPADLMIMDIAMPAQSGIKVIETLRSAGIPLPVLIFSMHPASQYVAHLRRMGAHGFIGKEADERSLLVAIRQVLTGGTSFPALEPARTTKPARQAPRGGALSMRESEVAQYLLRGKPLKVIAAELGISAQSVTTYRRRVLDKLGVRNNAELISLMRHND